MTPEERLGEILAALESVNLPCPVMGGHAVRFYGLSRHSLVEVVRRRYILFRKDADRQDKETIPLQHATSTSDLIPGWERDRRCRRRLLNCLSLAGDPRPIDSTGRFFREGTAVRGRGVPAFYLHPAKEGVWFHATDGSS